MKHRPTLEDFQMRLGAVASLLWRMRTGKGLERDLRPEELAEIEAEACVHFEKSIVKNLAYSRRSVKALRRDLRFLRQVKASRTRAPK